MSDPNFIEFFAVATGHGEPFDYQARLPVRCISLAAKDNNVADKRSV
jgi:hypothetical protein